MKTVPKIRVMLVDDHFAILMGLRACLKPEGDIVVVAEATDGLRAILAYREHRPDVTLMDLRLPQVDGIEAIRSIRQEFPAARIIALTTRRGDEDMHRAMEAGASSYLTKNMPRQEMLTAIRSVHEGKAYLPAEIQAALQQRQSRPDLSTRELEVLHCLAQGRSNKEISTDLSIAEITVKNHITHLMVKLGVLDRLQAVLAAQRLGIIHLGDSA